MRTLNLRKAAAVAVLPLAISSLAACGGNDSSSVATDPAAGSSSSSAPSSDASTPSEGSTVNSADFLATIKAATKKITTTTFQMVMDFSGQSIKATGAMDMTSGSPALKMSMTLPGTGQATTMILVGANIYVQVPGSGTKYMKIDTSDPNGPLGSLGGTLDSLDPQALLDQMSPDVFKKVTYVGSDSVGKHYTVELDTTALPMLKGLPSSATSSIPKTMNYDIWLDDQGRMVQFKILLKNVMQMTANYGDFGGSVDITAPDPSQVESMPALPSAGTS